MKSRRQVLGPKGGPTGGESGRGESQCEDSEGTPRPQQKWGSVRRERGDGLGKQSAVCATGAGGGVKSQGIFMVLLVELLTRGSRGLSCWKPSVCTANTNSLRHQGWAAGS